MISVVGRFLEHSRIYAFDRGDECTVYIGSADLMPRNLDTRVELLTPIRDESLRADLIDTLDRCFADNTNCWELDTDGAWTRRTPGGDEPRNVQRELMAAHAAVAAERQRRRLGSTSHSGCHVKHLGEFRPSRAWRRGATRARRRRATRPSPARRAGGAARGPRHSGRGGA